MPRSPSLPTHCADLPAVRGRVPPPRAPMPGRGTAEPPTRRGAARRTGTMPRRTPAAQSADRPHPARRQSSSAPLASDGALFRSVQGGEQHAVQVSAASRVCPPVVYQPCRQSVCRCLHGVQNDQSGRRRKVAPAGQQSGEQKLDCHEQSCGAVRGAQTVPVVHGMPPLRCIPLSVCVRDGGNTCRDAAKPERVPAARRVIRCK